jgi:hypothetical protein
MKLLPGVLMQKLLQLKDICGADECVMVARRCQVSANSMQGNANKHCV